jgi:hypothetical protein
MYKVFINNFPVFLASANETINIKNPFVDINCESKSDAKKIIHRHILANGTKTLVARNTDIELLWKYFFEDYVPVKAAGGLVFNEKKEMLFIFRNKKWDLPKGKIDGNEDEETAALREVNEECGLVGHSIESKIINTYHTYPFDNSLAIKTTAWFLMKVKNTNNLKPQLEEGITDVVWKSKNDFPEIMKNTYGSIEDVLKEF